MRRILPLLGLLAFASPLAAQCSNLPPGQTCVSVASLRITGSYADHVDVKPGASLNLNFVALDSMGKNITHHIVKWTVADSSVASITTGGKLTGLRYGRTAVQVQVGAQFTVLPVLVSPYAAANCTTTTTNCATVAVLQMVPPNPLGDTTDHIDAKTANAYSMNLIAKDPSGNNISGHTVQWWSADTTILSSTVGGRITGKNKGETDLWLKVGISMTKLPACVVNADQVPLILSSNWVKNVITDTLQADTVAVLPDTVLLMFQPIALHETAEIQLFAHEAGSYRRRSDPCVHWTSVNPNVTVDRKGYAKFAVRKDEFDSTDFHPTNWGVKAALGRKLP